MIKEINTEELKYISGDNNTIEFQVSFDNDFHKNEFINWWNCTYENNEKPHTDYRNGQVIHVNFGDNKMVACGYDMFVLDDFKNKFYEIVSK